MHKQFSRICAFAWNRLESFSEKGYRLTRKKLNVVNVLRNIGASYQERIVRIRAVTSFFAAIFGLINFFPHLRLYYKLQNYLRL